MARMARIKMEETEGGYHIHCQIAGVKGDCVLAKPMCRNKFVDLLKFYSKVCGCELASFCIMGSHWHGVLGVESPPDLSEGGGSLSRQRM